MPSAVPNRGRAGNRGNSAAANPQEQAFGMLAFESFSAGILAVLLAMGAVLILVGVYAYFIWPFTHWNLESLQLGNESMWKYALGLIFIAGSAAGYWCFSGAAFREKAVLAPARTVRPSR
jgi:hypothetical protein